MIKKLLFTFFLLGSCFCVKAQSILGIDISHWQGTINWNQVKQSGKVFAFIKATQGDCYVDPTFLNNASEARNAGLIVGAYHFSEPEGLPPKAQAAYFVSKAKDYIGEGFLPPVLDLENPGGICGGDDKPLSSYFTSTELSNWADSFCTEVQRLTGVTPLIYTGSSHAGFLNNSLKEKYNLWIAKWKKDPNYTPGENDLRGWSDWQFMQYDDEGSVPGITGNVDLNVFHGSLDDFKELINANPYSPRTEISAEGKGWKTKDFKVRFYDVDFMGGSGIKNSFYLVSGYDGNLWEANEENGFLIDEFENNSIKSIWTKQSGNWDLSMDETLLQTEENNTNTNIFAYLNQDSSDAYLYSWQGKISGSGTNRKAGLYFFVNDATQTNRRNAYFINMAIDEPQEIRIYKSLNNISTLKKSSHFELNADQWYHYTVVYNKNNGELLLFIDGEFVTKWIDPSPLQKGNYVSFRTNKSGYEIDNFKVFKTRSEKATITVGSNSKNDLRFQNSHPSSPAGRISTIVIDTAYNISKEKYIDINVDWTPPLFSGIIKDGLNEDLDTTNDNSSFSANWELPEDDQSDVNQLLFTIGTNPGDSDVVAWRHVEGKTSITINYLKLKNNQLYYSTLKAVNGAGLTDTITSNGILIQTSPPEFENKSKTIVYPNPFDKELTIQTNNVEDVKATIKIYNAMGETVYVKEATLQAGKTYTINGLDYLAKGAYFMRIHGNGIQLKTSLIKN